MIIGIIPTIRNPYKNQIELSYDKRLVNFLDKINTKIEIILINEKTKINKNFKLLVFRGGNNIIQLSKKKDDIYRSKIDKFFFKKAISLKIPMLGICHGAQFGSSNFNTKFKKKKQIGDHKIKLVKNDFINFKKNSIKVNSFHNYVITKISSKLELLAKDNYNFIEAFFIKNIKFLGIMWHPERNKKFKKFDFDLIKKLL